MENLHLLIAYDITDNKKRRTIYKQLKRFGARQQYSFFECVVNLKQYERLISDLVKLIDKNDGDRLGIVKLCPRCKENAKRFGYDLPDYLEGDFII